MSNLADKISVLHIALSKTWRGGEQQVLYLMEELEEQEKINSFLACHKDSVIAQKCETQNLKYFPHSGAHPFNPSFLWFLKRTIKKHQIQILHAHDARAHIAAVLLADLFGVKVPIIAARRVDFPLKQKWFTQHKYNHQQVKKIVCVSHKIQEIVEPNIIDNTKLVTIHSGVNLHKFTTASHVKTRHALSQQKSKTLSQQNPKIQNPTIKIGTVGALVGHKDHKTFVNTAEIILKTIPNCHFVIIGEGPKRSEIEAQLKEKQLTEKFTLTGFREDVPQLLSELDLFLFTSNKEGLGTSVIDALAAQLPIVATIAGGIPEIIEHEKSGLLAEKENPQALADACLSILQNDELRRTLIKKAGERAKVFSKEATAMATLSLYRQVL